MKFFRFFIILLYYLFILYVFFYKPHKGLAENFININGNYRLGYEFYNNYNILSSQYKTQQSYILSRLRINTELNFSKNFTFHTQIQDSEIIDSPVSDKTYKGKNNPYHNPFDINELYLKLQI